MCSVVGALLYTSATKNQVRTANSLLRYMWDRASQRGRDGCGYAYYDHDASSVSLPKRIDRDKVKSLDAPYLAAGDVMIGNFRAEPTAERIHQKTIFDQQPYELGQWFMVHNGVISNDQELRTHTWPSRVDSAAIIESLAVHDAEVEEKGETDAEWEVFQQMLADIKGSFAILAFSQVTPDAIYFACNYRPLWMLVTDYGVFFASSRSMFLRCHDLVPRMIPPYSSGAARRGVIDTISLFNAREPVNTKALVVCSGGMDSVVAATVAKHRDGFDITLLHFDYGSRAAARELEAATRVANDLRCPLIVQKIDVYRPEDSPLLNHEQAIADGPSGIETAHEWVPARNLVMLSIATAIAEARGMQTVILGNNMEEAGAYPDNEPEFIDRFNDLLPFAVHVGARMAVLQPVGNLMKHEIVQLGDEFGAPFHLAWSCYQGGAKHCGQCSSCYTRRVAFRINNIPEVIEYEHEEISNEKGRIGIQSETGQ